MEIAINKLNSGLNKFWNRFKICFANKKSLFYYFLILIGLGIGVFFLALVTNGWTIPLSGDYVMQQFAFYTNGYDDWWKFLTTGEFTMWDPNTAYGVNNIGSNTFYYLFNPFFLPILLCPRFLIPQGMACLMILKVALAGLSFRYFLKVIGISERNARLFGLAYAFSGWMAYFLWFNHFMEIAVVFPLVFAGIEIVIKKKRPWVLMSALFIMGLTNYFYLVGTCIAGVIYALFRFCQTAKEKSFKDGICILGIGVGAFSVGLLMSTFVLWPSLTTAMGSDRVNNSTYLSNIIQAFSNNDIPRVFNLLFTWDNVYLGNEFKASYPIISFFFPCMSDRGVPIIAYNSFDNTACSLFIYTPCALLLFEALLNSIRKKKISHLIAWALILLALFTPFFYYLSYGFSKDYGRWQLIVVLVSLGYIAKYFEQRKNCPRWTYDVGFVIALLLMVVAVIVSIYLVNNYQQFEWREGGIAVIIIWMFYLLICYVGLSIFHKWKHLHLLLMSVIAIEAFVMGGLTLYGHSLSNYYTSACGGVDNVRGETSLIEKVTSSDLGYYRIYSDRTNDVSKNNGMLENFNSLGFFHSLYNFNLYDFFDWYNVTSYTHGWSAALLTKRAYLETFLNVKYYSVQKDFQFQGTKTNKYINVPLGYDYYDENDRFYIYKNNRDFLDFGFAFDNVTNLYNNNEDPLLPSLSQLRRDELLLETAFLKNDDVKEITDKYEDINQNVLSGIYTGATQQSTTKEIRTLCSSFLSENQRIDASNLVGCPIYSSNDEKGAIVITPPRDKEVFDGFKDGTYINIGFDMRKPAQILIYDKDNNLIVADRHSNTYMDVSVGTHSYRGFYSPKEVKTIIIIPDKKEHLIGGVNVLTTPYRNIYSEPTKIKKTGFRDRIEYLQEHASLKNITVHNNKYTFTSDFIIDNVYPNSRPNKFVVLTIPYDEGWSLKAFDKNHNQLESPKLYKTNGGFLGFVSPKGEIHYELSYYTPYLKEGMIISQIAITAFIYSYLATIYLDLKKKQFDKIDLFK